MSRIQAFSLHAELLQIPCRGGTRAVLGAANNPGLAWARARASNAPLRSSPASMGKGSDAPMPPSQQGIAEAEAIQRQCLTQQAKAVRPQLAILFVSLMVALGAPSLGEHQAGPCIRVGCLTRGSQADAATLTVASALSLVAGWHTLAAHSARMAWPVGRSTPGGSITSEPEGIVLHGSTQFGWELEVLTPRLS